MDFLNLLIPKEKILALEISDRKIRMLYLEKDAYGKIKIGGISQENFGDGVISNGIIKDKARFGDILLKAKSGFKPAKQMPNFVIVTIPQNGVYSEILEFPKDLTSGQLIEAISLNAAGNLPFALSDCYLDWQIIENVNSKNKVLVSLISKKTVDSYTEILKEKKFNLIALEPISLSLSRAVDLPDDPVIFLYFSNSGVTSIAYKNKFPYLSQYESWSELSDGKGVKDIGDISSILRSKIRSMVNYFENEYEGSKIKKILIMNDETGADAVVENIGEMPTSIEVAKPKLNLFKDDSCVQVSGAALRAFIPRGEDTIISLLPVGTESLYETQKAVSFIQSILLLLSSLSLFYVAVFAASFIFVSSMESRTNAQVEARVKMPLPVEYQKIESETVEFNGYARDIAKIYAGNKKDYSEILEAVNKLNAPGISLNSASYTDANDYISVSGVALNRDIFDSFKSLIDNLNIFRDVKYSVQNIAQKNNIPFSLTLYPK